MKPVRIILALTATLALTACSAGDFVTRKVNADAPLLQVAPDAGASEGTPLLARNYAVTALNVQVPATLAVSEANSYKPKADIVWREDPIGDRHAQVNQIFRDAMGAGVGNVTGERPVVVDVNVTRFHALTERTRYSIGGTHDIHFTITVTDAETGVVVEPMRLIETSLTAFGGRAALAAEAAGQTQKVRISAHLKALITRELSAPYAPQAPLVADATAAN